MKKGRYRYIACVLFILIVLQLQTINCYAQTKTEKKGIVFTSEELAWMKKHPVVTLGFNDQMEPLLIQEPVGTFTGIYPDLYNEIDRLLPIDIIIEVDSWDTIVKRVRNREIDGLLGCAPSQAKASKLISTIPTHKNFPVLYAKQNAQFEINSLADIKGKTIMYQKEVKLIEKALEPYADSCEVIAVNTLTDALLAVLDGRADLAMGLRSNTYLAAKNLLSGLKIVLFDFEHQTTISSAIRDDWPELATIINKALQHIGQVHIQQILERWVGISESIPLILLNTKEKQWLKDHPVINVEIDENMPPVSFLDGEGNYQGFIVDYLTKIEEIIGINFNYVNNNQYQPDIIAYLPKINDSKPDFICTKKFIEMPTGIFVLEGVNFIADLKLLDNKEIAIVKEKNLQNYLVANHPKIIIKPVDNTAQGIQSVLNQEAFAFIGNVVTTGHLINKKGYVDIDMAGEFPFAFKQCLRVRNDWSQLTTILNKAIDAISVAEYNTLYNKWVPLQYEAPYNYSVLWKIGIGILLVIGSVVYWNRRLAIIVKKQTAQVLDKEQKFRSVYELSRDAIVVMNRYNFVDCNRAALNLFGYVNKEEFCGKHPADVSPEFQPDGTPSIQKIHELVALALQGEGDMFEWIHTHKNGSVFPCEILLSPLKWDGEKIVQAVIRDITNRKKAELEIENYKNHLEKMVKVRTEEVEMAIKHLKEAQAQLVQSEKMASLGILTAGVAHEINNPLNYIKGSYYGLKNFLETELAGNERLAVLLNGLSVGIERTSSIVKGLNEFSRGQEGFEETCNIHSILDNCLVMLNSQFSNRIEIDKNYAEEQLESVGNVGKLHQVFINILTNSIQAIEANGKINISTKKNNKTIQIEVTDTGSGISEADLPKILDPFFTTKDPGEGTGLGLSISYKIIKQHYGNLEFKSEKNKGTTATVTLPIKNDR